MKPAAPVLFLGTRTVGRELFHQCLVQPSKIASGPEVGWDDPVPSGTPGDATCTGSPVIDEEDEGSMTLNVGQRVRLAADLRLAGSVTPDGEPPEETSAFAASLALAAGIEGTVERVDEHHRQQSHEVREYLRLKSLLDDFGHQMPPASREQLEEKVGALEDQWAAYQRRMLRVTVRVRLDNGFVLDDVPEEAFDSA
ncbi:hypothetical protein [Streptomyces sp. NPDC006446]|uniref:hypothetical protein n=1 Tax=Streptomyces sp. NPDC006446 TaxID=3154301 RepID=UPI0033AC28A3